MGETSYETNIFLKAKYAFYSMLIFFLVANPETYKITESFFGRFFTVANNGCPTSGGFFFHTILFFFILWGIMLFPRDPY
jgi:hypothetical protein